GIPYKEAAAQLAATVLEYRRLLDTDGRFSIDRIGVFYKDRLGQVQFIPDDQENFLMASHGLKPIQLKLIGGMENTGASKVIDINRGRDLRKWKIAAAIAVPALLVGSWMLGSRMGSGSNMNFASLNPFGEPRKESSYQPVTDSWDLPMRLTESNFDEVLITEIPVSIDFVNGTSGGSGIALEHAKNQSPSDVVSTETVNLDKTNRNNTTQTTRAQREEGTKTETTAYTLIGGAFQVKENAQRLTNQLRARGYDAQLAGMKGDLHLVAIGNFNDRNKAEAVKAKVLAEGSQAWIRTNQ
ncbi:MAG: SPOR domain-containing protein, partial [Flavobacteriales bacterium]